MKNYRITNENLPQFILQLDNFLGNIEVKGESVRHLGKVRDMVKEMFDAIEEFEIEKEEPNKEE